MIKHPLISSTIVIGAGPIIIGQACEFDCSGAQGSVYPLGKFVGMLG